MGAVEARISDDPLDVAAAITAVSDPATGGTAVFVGTVRRSSATGEIDRAVLALEYDAHPELAQPHLEEIARAAQARFDLERVVAIHRIGRCELGEPTVVVACSAPHRAAALEGCRWMIDEIKSKVPIWKKEIFADGTAWVEHEAS
ncbi:MAG TPA: molybdenum cofactor biosynthesis protein MoaE [Actinomycetota bacterium]|nr:molybdenum cofactor biosynthesis protein MoaE [Actinomycetota bacterium]